MKKILFAVLLSIVLLSACNLDSEKTTETAIITPTLEAAIEIYRDDPAIVGSLGQPGGPKPPGEPRLRVIELIKTLVSKGINTTHDDGHTALIYASQHRYTEIVKVLIAEGANLEAKTTAPKETVGGTALIFAANKGHTEAIKALIAAGANVNAQNNNGWTALIYAAWRLDIVSIKALIEAGANVNLKTKDGVTALIYAALRGHTEAVQALIDAGADVNAQATFFGNRIVTPLTAAGGNQVIVGLLKAAGATE